MFRLTWNEVEMLKPHIVTSKGTAAKNSRSQNVTLKQGRNVKYLPYRISSLMTYSRPAGTGIAPEAIWLRMSWARVRPICGILLS